MRDASSIWPEDVLDRARERSLLLVIGAGISRSTNLPGAPRPPSWVELLAGLITNLRIGGCQKNDVEELITRDRLLDAAELIRREASATSRDNDMLKYIRMAVDGKEGQPFSGNRWHEALVRLEPRLILTTNYDKIIERATNHGYTTHTYDYGDIAADVRRNVPVLIKLHGSVDHIDKIILTRRDYTRLRKDGAQTLRLVESLLQTRTALFVGYSVRDPDMQLILENVLGARDGAPAHYILTEDSLPDYEKDLLRYCYGTTPVLYPAGDYDRAFECIDILAAYVETSEPEI